MTIMTLVWGVGLLADAAASIALAYVLPIRAYLVVNPIMGYATIASLTFWNDGSAEKCGATAKQDWRRGPCPGRRTPRMLLVEFTPWSS